ncbi:VOC family protein [Gillisia sp. M10.2A]|uniref:VOC family protein n=1 Tax=Gillisia lutea TaxID=2909668 RepID=A0ABS9EJE5_9FLAO|nr:VOC family protein [Gillisia lutea]MCF4102309.1 VOC family protein [Gillisia lutea]
MSNLQPFHLAIPVSNVEENRNFYRDVLGCEEGRSSEHWVDFNFFGHQLVIHEQETPSTKEPKGNPVDGKDVPIPHFGVVLEWDVFQQFAENLKNQNIQFVIEPYIRFKGKTGEQATMFFKDPSGNALEFKSFKNIDQLFAK